MTEMKKDLRLPVSQASIDDGSQAGSRPGPGSSLQLDRTPAGKG